NLFVCNPADEVQRIKRPPGLIEICANLFNLGIKSQVGKRFGRIEKEQNIGIEHLGRRELEIPNVCFSLLESSAENCSKLLFLDDLLRFSGVNLQMVLVIHLGPNKFGIHWPHSRRYDLEI